MRSFEIIKTDNICLIKINVHGVKGKNIKISTLWKIKCK